MFKDLSAKYYQNNKERHKRKFMKNIFLKKKKKESNNMIVNHTKICQKMKNKSLLSIEKKL